MLCRSRPGAAAGRAGGSSPTEGFHGGGEAHEQGEARHIEYARAKDDGTQLKLPEPPGDAAGGRTGGNGWLKALLLLLLLLLLVRTSPAQASWILLLP